MQKNEFHWYVVLFITFIIWGTQHPPIKILSGEMSPILFNVLRYSIAVLALLPFVLKNKPKFEKNDLMKISLISFIGVFLFGILNLVGVNLSTSTNNAILLNSWPLLIIILAPLLIKEKILTKQILGMIIGFIGVIFIITNGINIAELIKSDFFVGNILIILSALCMALYSIFNKKYIEKYGGLQITFYCLSIGAFLFLISSIITKEIFLISQINLNSFLLMLWIAIPTTALAYVVFFKSIAKIGVVKTSSFFFIIPVSGIISSWFFLGEEITLFTIIGTVLILFGVWIVQKK